MPVKALNDPCPCGWRVPTHAEFVNLADKMYVTNIWITVNGIKGTLFTDKATNNTIFLPAASLRGSRGEQSPYGNGYYWSSGVDGFDSRVLIIGSGSTANPNLLHSRIIGSSVRCVKE
jgi:uncharacterized protein (TIGR02145 family)